MNTLKYLLLLTTLLLSACSYGGVGVGGGIGLGGSSGASVGVGVGGSMGF